MTEPRRRCLFCGGPFEANDTVEAQPVGHRLAFDPHRGRLWLVCGHCFRWSLAPLEGRARAIEALEFTWRREEELARVVDEVLDDG